MGEWHKVLVGCLLTAGWGARDPLHVLTALQVARVARTDLTAYRSERARRSTDPCARTLLQIFLKIGYMLEGDPLMTPICWDLKVFWGVKNYLNWASEGLK